MSYLNNYDRPNRYEDSLDIIDGTGFRYYSCHIELGTETREGNCAPDYTGTVKYKRNVYGSGAAANLEECKSTRKTYSNWIESSNNCVYTPVCSEEYQEKVKLSCPAGQEGEIVKTIKHRSKHYGKRVEVSVCNDYDTTESTENTCRTIIPPVYNPDEIEAVPHCNDKVAVNGETGKWIRFKRGGLPFWAPFYTKYIEENGMQKFYEKVFNAKNNNNLESIFKVDDKGNSCTTLKDEFKNENAIENYTTIGDSKLYGMDLYNDASFDLDVKLEGIIRFTKPLTLTANRINIDSDKRSTYTAFEFVGGQPSNLNVNDLIVKNVRTLFCGNVNVNADTINLPTPTDGRDIERDFSCKNDNTLVLNVNTINAPDFNYEKKWNLDTDKRKYNINAKEVRLKTIITPKNFSKENPNVGEWNIENLIVSKGAVMPGQINFTGNVETNGELVSYGNINGDVCIRTDDYFVNFGQHSGNSTCNTKNDALELIPHEYCNNNISVNGQRGKWVKFKSGSRAIWKPFYTDYIAKNGRPKLFDMVLNYDELKNSDLEFGEADEAKQVECIMMDNRFKADEIVSISKIGNTITPVVRVTKDAKYNLDVTTRTINLMNRSKLKGDSLNVSIVDTYLNSAFVNANLDIAGDIHIAVNPPEKARNYQYFTLFGSSNYFDQTYDVITIKAQNLFVTSNDKNAYFRSIGRLYENKPLRLDINIENEISMPNVVFNNYNLDVAHNRNPIFNIKARLIKLKKLDFPMQYYSNMAKSKWEFEEMRVDDEAIISGNINVFGNIKTNNKIRLYGYLKGDIYTKQDASVIDIFGRHEGRIFGNDIGYETE